MTEAHDRHESAGSREGSKNVSGTLTHLDVLPALPKLRGKCTVVTTKLCEAKLKSTTGLFDLSFPQEYLTFSSEYNSLHDPCLKDYFYREDIQKKLIRNGFVTKDLYVKSSLKEYNEYRRFLENEFMKVRKREDYDKEARNASRCQRRAKSEAEVERDQKRQQFFRQQEKKLKRRQRKLRKLEQEEAFIRMRKEEQRLIRKEQFEIQREAEREQRRLRHIKEELVDEKKKKIKLRRTSELERQRILHLEEEKQKMRMKHAKEMEEKWQRWEEHSQKAKEDEEERKRKEEEDKRRRMEKRERIFRILQSREEERRKVVAEQNLHQAEDLKKEADMLEKQLKEKKDRELKDWKENFKRKSLSAQRMPLKSSRTSVLSSEPSHSQCSISSASKLGRQVRFQSKHVIIPLTITEDELKAESIDCVDLSDSSDDEDDDRTECSLPRKVVSEQDSRENFILRQKAEEIVCTVISKAVKTCL